MDNQEQLAATLLSEALIPVGSLPAILPAACSGRPMARAAVWRWVVKGLRGPDGMRVRLEVVRLGKRWVTSRQALSRFMARTTRSAGASRSAAAPAPAASGLQPSTVASVAARGIDVSKFGGAP